MLSRGAPDFSAFSISCVIFLKSSLLETSPEVPLLNFEKSFWKEDLACVETKFAKSLAAIFPSGKSLDI